MDKMGMRVMGQARAIGMSLMVKTARHGQVGPKGLFPAVNLCDYQSASHFWHDERKAIDEANEDDH